MAQVEDLHSQPARWTRTLVHEAIEYWINFVYLAVFLGAFLWYRRLILAEYQIHYTNYWFSVIEAAALAKVIMVGDILRLGRRLEHRPLILPTLYRTVVFSVWVGVFSVLEATVRGLLRRRGLMAGVEEIVSKGPYEVVAWGIVIFVAFLPFFALRELDRVLGQGKLRSLFWRRVAAGAETSRDS